MVGTESNKVSFQQNIDRLFSLQLKEQYKVANTTSRDRVLKLNKLKKAICETYSQEIKTAVFNDLRKHEAEVELNEIFPVVTAIKHTVSKLGSWMQDKGVSTPISMFGFSHKIKYEPKGVVLIIAPWNFPINLSLIPLVSAIAAGNTVILKPSEHAAHSSASLKKIITSIFDESEVAVIEGGIPETTYLLEKPFNHIFFTGAPQIGKIVMKAAAKNLTSVSLELGGKSPTIVDETADLRKAASRIAWAKCVNNGQVCVAPDYILIHHSKKDEFVSLYKQEVLRMYGNDSKSSASYGRIINDRHFGRLNSYLQDAIEKGGKIELGGKVDQTDNYIEPTVISDLPEEALLWQEEIFGPILPIKTFKEIDEVLSYINKGEKPLALYIYSKNKKNIKHIVDNTRSGACAINYSVTHVANPNLPFGGSNNSGIGKGNGRYGFLAFSNAKGIQNFWSPFDSVKMFFPPYSESKSNLIHFVSKWLS